MPFIIAYSISTIIAVVSIFWLWSAPDWEPLIASLGGVLGIVGVSAVKIFQDQARKKEHKVSVFLRGSKKERDRYYGNWKGDGHDVNLPKERGATNIYTDVHLILEEQDERIKGAFSLTVKNEKKDRDVRLHCNVELIAVCGDFILLRFAMTKLKADHFGVIFFRLSEAGDKLNGYFLKKRVYGTSRLGLGEFELLRDV